MKANEAGNMTDTVDKAELVRNAVLSCSHTIDAEEIVLRREPGQKGNALRQLSDRIAKALASHTEGAGAEPVADYTELLDELERGVFRSGEGDNGEELYAVDDASDTMYRAAQLIRSMIAARPIPAPEGKVADADGWIEWRGGDAPLPPETRVDVRRDDGIVFENMPVSLCQWAAGRTLIIAYRIVPPSNERE